MVKEKKKGAFAFHLILATTANKKNEKYIEKCQIKHK